MLNSISENYQGAKNAFSAVPLLRSRDQRSLTCVPNCYVDLFFNHVINEMFEIKLMMGREMQVASREMQVAIAKCRGIGEFSGVRPMAYPWRTFVTPLS